MITFLLHIAMTSCLGAAILAALSLFYKQKIKKIFNKRAEDYEREALKAIKEQKERIRRGYGFIR